jgi:hypothetical protein
MATRITTSFLKVGNSSSLFDWTGAIGGAFSMSIDVEFRAGSDVGSVVAVMSEVVPSVESGAEGR